MQQLWLPMLVDQLARGGIDMAITCGAAPQPEGTVQEVFCAEPLLVALRPDHPMAAARTVDPLDLADDVLGLTRQNLVPA